MASCSYCDSFILFGGKTDSTGYYCNARCQQAGNLLALSSRIPEHEIEKLVQEVHHANCPRCGSPGPVDVHKAHKVWSALVLTSWNSSPALCCKSCGTKRQAGAILFSGFFGWWGFPWGLVMTPTQIVRNVVEMFNGPVSGQPSDLLRKMVRLQAAAGVAQRSAAQSAFSTVTPPPLIQDSAVPAHAGVGDDSRYMPK